MNMKNMGEPRLKILAMPVDTNPEGNIFGGWILSQVDIAGAIAAKDVSPQRVVTVAMEKVVFTAPVFVGDIVSCYAKITAVGNTSIQVEVEVSAERVSDEGVFVCIPVTSARLTYVSVDKNGVKKLIDPELKKVHGF